MNFFEWLFALNPIWILWVAFFVMIYSLANSRRGSANLFSNSLAATIVAIATLTVGWHEEQMLSACFGLVGGLILGIGIPFFIKRR